MMRTNLSFLFLVFLLFQFPATGQDQRNHAPGKQENKVRDAHWELEVAPDSSIDWQTEIGLLAEELAKTHPDLFFMKEKDLFSREMKAIAGDSEGRPPFPVAVKLQQAVAGLGDAQTRINYHYLIDPKLILPVECYWFEEGIYVLKTLDQYRSLLGKRIVAVNNTPVERVIDSLSTLIPPANPSLVREQVPRMIAWTQLLHHFGFCEKEELVLTAAERPGERVSVTLSLPAADDSFAEFRSGRTPLGWEDRITFFRDRHFPGEGLYYIQYNKCWSREAEEQFGSGASALFMPVFADFEKKVLRTLRQKEVNTLVFDLRFNDGGNTLQGSEFIRKLSKKKYTNRTAVYVAVGRGTTTEAMVHAVELADLTSAVTVGEPTGGWINFFGEERRFVLPGSGLVVSCSTRLFELTDDGRHPLQPRLQAPVSFETFRRGIDPVVERIRAERSSLP